MLPLSALIFGSSPTHPHPHLFKFRTVPPLSSTSSISYPAYGVNLSVHPCFIPALFSYFHYIRSDPPLLSLSDLIFRGDPPPLFPFVLHFLNSTSSIIYISTCNLHIPSPESALFLFTRLFFVIMLEVTPLPPAIKCSFLLE